MPQLLLELFSEEIPARMQSAAARDLERLVVGALTDRGFLNEGARGFATPRRLALAIEGLPATQSDVREERKGPKVDAPDAAIQGFLRSTGLAKEQLKIQKDAKGDFYLAVTERKGRPTPDVLAELIPEMIELIQKLLTSGHAYISDDGSVYFDVKSFKKYGNLAHLDMK